MVVEMVPLSSVGSVAYNPIIHPPIGRKFMPLIVLAFVWGLYNPKFTLYRNLKNPLIHVGKYTSPMDTMGSIYFQVGIGSLMEGHKREKIVEIHPFCP